MEDKNLAKLKIDKEFLKELEKKEEEALKSGKISLMYDVLDTLLALDMEADRIDRLYSKILETAFDALAEYLTSFRHFDLSKEEELYTVRAIYEHALERYDEGDFKGAKELFLILSLVTDDEDFKKAMLLHTAAAAASVDLNAFLQKFVDHSKLDENSFFFTVFTEEAEDFMEKNRDAIEKELENLKKLASGEGR
ncbi:hypothetical protein [Nitrosophilus alvini]|uniref:hypothetical protein n=1 Tax=Nitrosophilus alvini TaxID=2714855 RepID=UPI00190C8C16|nr:hypothetical protein [Nitrosophilus alvini]